MPLLSRYVNFKHGIITLPIGSTKNGEGRTFSFGEFPELRAFFEARWKEMQQLQRECRIVILLGILPDDADHGLPDQELPDCLE